MDFESKLCWESNTADNMAASKAPTTANTTNVSSTSTSTSSTTTDNIEHNFHELCRSCGKTNAELYDLFQTTNSPFSTSSTTCYTHLNNCNFTSGTTATTASTTAANKSSTSTASTAISTVAAGCTKSSSSMVSLTAFDSVAATAKATAKGQSNMDNILQEMQIWQLLIKCNDGLPQRICAKCTAQFYMIHKFRRKCLKVQTQLRTLYEEQQQKFYERRQHQQQQQQQQQQNENNVTVKDATTIEATSTPPTAEAKATSLLVEVVKPPAVMHKVNDLVNDNYDQQPEKEEEEDEERTDEQQQQEQQENETNVDNTNTKSSSSSTSVSFEANTGNTNDFIAPTTTLLDTVETMPQKTEANEPTPTSSPPPPPPPPVPATAFNDKTFEARVQEHCCTVTTGPLKLKDEKKPLLKPSVLVAKRSPPLTLQQPLEQICDNDNTLTAEQTTACKSFCLDQEDLLDTHIIFKTNIKQNNLPHSPKSTDDASSTNSSPIAKANLGISQEDYANDDAGTDAKSLGQPKLSAENLFITKAALKAYTIPPATSEQTENRDHQKPITNSEAIELKNANDDNNNNAHINTIYTSNRYDNRNQQLNDSACSSTSTSNSNSTPTSSSSFSSTFSSGSPLRCCSQKRKRLNNAKTKIIKYASHNKRRGHCYKANAKAASEVVLTTVAATKMARTIQSYGKCSIVCSTGMTVKRKRKHGTLRQDQQHKLKRLLHKTKSKATTTTTTTSTSLKATRQTRRRKKKRHLQNFKICHKNSIQIEDEMSATTVSTTSLMSAASTSPTSASSSAISSTSPCHLRAITPAATDLVRNRNMTKKGWSSADRLSSSLKTCSKMWKTKAAMKANANDMPVKVENGADGDGHDDQPTANKPQITLPYLEATTTSTTAATISNGSISSSATSSTSSTLPASSSTSSLSAKSLTEIHKSSKTPTDNQNKTNNLSLDEYGNHNKVTMSSTTGKQDKDTKNYESENVCNLKTEEADQKPFNTNNSTQQQSENAANKIAAIENDSTGILLNNLDLDNKKSENPHEELASAKEDQQKHIITTPPAKMGSMKLIIQRKRGKRFKCRRKDDDELSLPNASQHNHDEEEPLTAKRKRKKSSSSSYNLKSKLKETSSLPPLDDTNSQKDQAITCLNLEAMPSADQTNDNHKVADFNSSEVENKENPITIVNNYDFDSDSNASVYRDPLLVRNEALEEDTHVTDFVKIQLSIQNECSKEMYKLYKEKANLESPKKLIVRVPLTSLTQDFKRLHLTKDEHDKDEENQPEIENDLNISDDKGDILCVEVTTKTVKENLSPAPEETSQLNTSSTQSDFLGFSQNTETSSVSSAEMIRYIEPPLCSASSKINDFINDFQNNCIDSSEIEESCDMVPTLAPHLTQELSDEIRDVEDTLNGIISEMHDKDMYTPRSGETDEFFTHSVYSPLTDAPTTPSQSFYAESPCTINSNPMSVSPFIHHNMDYNAMTPQSNHSGMGYGSGSSYMGGGGSTGPHTSVYNSEHYPTYNECFEETQSELIGFQNDIPCFENIEMGTANNANELPAETNEAEDEEEEEEDVNSIAIESNNITNTTDPAEIELFAQAEASVSREEPLAAAAAPIATENAPPQQISYTNTNYQHISNTPTFHMQTAANPLVSRTTATQPHYIVTNTSPGSIIITNPTQINSQTREQLVSPYKMHSNNLQFVTLGQAMKTAHPASTNQLLHTNPGHHWPTTVTNAANFTQRPVLTTHNGTTTYFINAKGELYQANIPSNTLPNSPANTTIFVPPNTNSPFNKNRLDSTDNYVQAVQPPPPPPQQQHYPPQQSNNPSSQYIMLVNNLNGSPQYYTTTSTNNLNQTVSPAQQNITTPTVLIQPAQAIQNNQSPPGPSNTESGKTKTNHIPITPALEPRADITMHQQINQQLQKQIKERQLHLLQPRSPNVPQKINLVCRFCHKRPKFTNNVDYSNHIINIHPAEKPYNCPHCPTHFSRRSDRQMHVAQVHGARYQCAQCGLSFCAQRALDFHLQKYHANMGRSQQQPHLHQQQQPNSSSTIAPATYQLLQHNQQQRLVRVEDVHVQVTGENINKRSIDLAFDNAGSGDGAADINTSQSVNEVEMLSHTTATQQQQLQQQQKSRKLCCPDCNGDNDDCCGGGSGSDQNHCDQNDINSTNATQQAAANSNLQNTGNESVNNHHPQQHHPQHVTMPSPEQTEPDSTTTLRHFRKRQLCEISTSFTSSSPSSSSSCSFSPHNNTVHKNNNGRNDSTINFIRNSPDNVLAGDGGGGGEQIVVERSLRGSHNCLLCEESFTNEIALRKHHHLAHGAATQSSMTCSSATTTSSMPLVCTICKRGFRMRNALQRHMETHDAEGRPYECNICQVRFPRPSQLTLHKLTVHKFEKPNSCEECGKQFGTESAMKAHAAEHEQADRAAHAATAEPSTLPSSSSAQSQLSSRMHVNTVTNTEQDMNLQSTTSGEDSFASNLNNSSNVFNNATEISAASGLVS